MRSACLFLLVILCSCTNHKKEKTIDQLSRIDSLQFPLQNPLELNNLIDSVATQGLDSLSKARWTDKIMPQGLVVSKLYSARYLAKYNSVGNFRIVAVSTRADDWGKSFLIVSDKDQNLIDFIMIVDSYGDAADDGAGHQTVTGEVAWTNRINDSTFQRTRMYEKIDFYGETNQLNQRDSVLDKIQINSVGKFKVLRIDSVRTEKRRTLN